MQSFDTLSKSVQCKVYGQLGREWGINFEPIEYWEEYERIILTEFPETTTLSTLEMYPDTYTEYYLCKDNGNSNGWDFIYSSECGYEMRASEKTYPVWIGVSMDWDCDLGITYFSGFWECWYGGLMEIDS